MLRVAPQETILQGPPCVMDVGLSLAPSGLYWALGLARMVPVWLPQCHWTIVDDKEFPADARLVAHLTGIADVNEANAILARVRSDWREARETLGLESFPGVFWPSDGRAESVVPKDGDSTLVDRLHALAAGLDSRTQDPQPPAGANAMADCARDTLALAAALNERRPVVLVPLGATDAPPPVIEHLERAGIACSKLTGSLFAEALAASLLPALLASGLAAPLATRRLRLAALFIAAPGALAAAKLAERLAESDDDLAWNPAPAGAEADLWVGASGFYSELA